jgi:hypothetical protein
MCRGMQHNQKTYVINSLILFHELGFLFRCHTRKDRASRDQLWQQVVKVRPDDSPRFSAHRKVIVLRQKPAEFGIALNIAAHQRRWARLLESSEKKCHLNKM